MFRLIFITLILVYNISFAQVKNISGANHSYKHNYLLEKKGFTISYNDSLHTANWVGWTLEKSDIGEVERQNDFHPDTTLPHGFCRVIPHDYSFGGYDRGHLCNSQARTSTEELNSETFVMTNMIPQHPRCNRGFWKLLEDECQEWAKNGEYLTIYAGGLGGIGTLHNYINIPEKCWKVIFGHGSKPIVKIFLNDDSEKVIDISLEELEKITKYRFLE